MWEKIFIFSKIPEFDTVPFTLMKQFPFENGAWRPFCQLKCCFVKNDGFYFHFTAFEAKPKKGESGILSGSAISVSFGMGENGKQLLINSDAYGNQDVSLLSANGKEKAQNHKNLPEVSGTVLGGDQQGDYFSFYIKIPTSLSEELFSLSDLQEGNKIRFNAFYTIMENRSDFPKHFVALFDNGKNQDPKEALFDPSNTDILTAIDFA